MTKAYLPSRSDAEILRLMVQDWRSRRVNPANRGRSNLDEDDAGPEVYIALTPEGGIPAFEDVGSGTWDTGTDIALGCEGMPGSAECDIYQVAEDGDPPCLIQVGLKEVVYNLGVKVAESTWVLLIRDKFGSWFVSSTGSVASAKYTLVKSSVAFSSGFYKAVLTTPVDGFSWTNGAPVNVRGINGEGLKKGRRYLSNFVKVGTDGKPVYLAVATSAPATDGWLGCGWYCVEDYQVVGSGSTIMHGCPSCSGFDIPYTFEVTIAGIPDALGSGPTGYTGASRWNGTWIMTFNSSTAGFIGCQWYVILPDIVPNHGNTNLPGPCSLLLDGTFGVRGGGSPVAITLYNPYSAMADSAGPVGNVFNCPGDTAFDLNALITPGGTVTFHILPDCAEPDPVDSLTDDSGTCVVRYLGTEPGDGVKICSGPYCSEEEAAAVCDAGSGSGGGGGGPCPACDCLACGSPGISPTLTATITDKVGAFVDLPDTLGFGCVDFGSGHLWVATSTITVTLDGTPVTGTPQVAGGVNIPVLDMPFGVTPSGPAEAHPDMGYSCYPFLGIYHLDDGLGNTATVTIMGGI